MRTTVDLPDDLISEAMIITNISTKTDVIKEALVNLIQKEKIKKIKNCRGKIKLQVDIEGLRNR